MASMRFLESNPPTGMWLATGEIASHAPSLREIRAGGFGNDGWTEEGQLELRGNTAHEIQKRKLSRAKTTSAKLATRSHPMSVPESPEEDIHRQLTRSVTEPIHAPSVEDADQEIGVAVVSTHDTLPAKSAELPSAVANSGRIGPDETGTYPNGYKFPPKPTWQESVVIGLKGFASFVITPYGFLVTVYGLNIVAWGAMIFFLLVNAAPAMCKPSCYHPDSSRMKWIEVDAQILNALFSVTGFGLIPWRFRDLHYLLEWRVLGKHDALRKLAGVHRSWFRLPESDKVPEDVGPPPVYPSNASRHTNSAHYTEAELELLRNNSALPLPPSSIPPAPLTGVRAAPTKLFLLDTVVWMYILNTVFQSFLAGLTWGMNRFERPIWGVACSIILACFVSVIAGLIAFREGRRVKKVEGIPVAEPDPDEESLPNQTEKQKAIRRSTSGLVRKSTWYQRH